MAKEWARLYGNDVGFDAAWAAGIERAMAFLYAEMGERHDLLGVATVVCTQPGYNGAFRVEP